MSITDPTTLDLAKAPSLSGNPIVSQLTTIQRTGLCAYLLVREVPAGMVLMHEGEPGDSMVFLISGRATLQRHGLALRPLEPGDHAGELALLTGHARAASMVADTPLVLAELTREGYDTMAEREPELALALNLAIIERLGDQLTDMTDNVTVLLNERSLPRRTAVIVRDGQGARAVRTGTPMAALMPETVNGSPVVAASLDQIAVPLDTPLIADAQVAPLTAEHWEGRRILWHTAVLLVLEAAHRAGLPLRVGPAVGDGVSLLTETPPDAAGLAHIGTVLQRLVDDRQALRTEMWTVDEAASHFREHGCHDAAAALRTWREPTVQLVGCGDTYALASQVTLPTAERLPPLTIAGTDDGLRLHVAGLTDGMAPDPSLARAARLMTDEHRLWLGQLRSASVGAFNDLCIGGGVSQLIRIGEGFHEKWIGRIADAIVGRAQAVRVIGMAGPSSSGKTTFIKRLTVQLQIHGLNPVAISLDDYYVDRERTPKDAAGEYDYEAFEAIDSALLQRHVERLLNGETVRTARYDFLSGKSIPDGGPELTLGANDVLLLEGIHGLNPALLDGSVDPGSVFRVFVCPLTSLPLDHATWIDVSDLRLLRRIVRDRFQRGASAADNIRRWPSVRRGEESHIYPYAALADAWFDSALVYEPAVLKVYADRYLLEVPRTDPAHLTAHRLRLLLDRFVTIYPDHVPSTSILREFIGGSGFDSH
jgi:uridine kinase